MRRGIVCLAVVLTVLSCRTLLGYENHSEKDTVEKLLNSRIEVMNDFLYGEKNLYSLRSSLGKIERGKLLENDMTVLSMVMDNPTDFEMAVSVIVDDITSVRYEDNIMYMEAELKWLMLGCDGEYDMTSSYEIQCMEEDGTNYLSVLKIK